MTGYPRSREAGSWWAVAGILLAVLVAWPALAQEFAVETGQVAQLEERVARDAEATKSEARMLRNQLERRRDTARQSAQERDRQANEFRALSEAAAETAAAARQEAESLEAAAARWGQSPRDPRVAKRQSDLREQARSRFQDAEDWRERATSHEANAVRLAEDAAREAQDAAELEALIARLDVVLAHEPPAASPEPERPTLAEEGPTPGAAPSPPLADDTFTISLEDTLGVWWHSDEDWPFVIVPEDPDFEAYLTRLEAHTEDRVWKGNYTSLPAEILASRPGLARVVFTYRPRADEMNPAIPQWAREALEGELEWRLELTEEGNSVEPRFLVKWFPGEVYWEEADGKVWIDGLGTPLEFTLEKETTLEIEQASAPMLWLEPPGSSSPIPESMVAVMKGQPFKVKVRLPPHLAAEAGDSITVLVRGLTGGSSTQIRLHAGAVVGGGPVSMRPVDYTHRGLAGHEDEIVIADWGAEPERDPKIGSVEWILRHYQRSDEVGSRLRLSVRDREIVEFRYGDAYQEIVVYENWMTRGIDQHHDAAAAYEQTFRKILADPTAPAVKKAAASHGLRVLANYRALIEQADLHDLHRYYLGELYVISGVRGTNVQPIGPFMDSGDPRDRPLVLLSTDQANRLEANTSTGRGDPAYFTTLVNGFYEAVTGTTREPAAIRMDQRVAWTSQGERVIVARTLVSASEELSHLFQNTVGQIAYAVPRHVVQDANIMLFATDLAGRPVVGWERGVTAARFVVSTLVGFGQARIIRWAGRLRADAHRRLGNASAGRSTVRMRGERAAELVGEGFIDTGGLPATLRPAQLRRTVLRLEANPDPTARGGPRCAGARAPGEGPVPPGSSNPSATFSANVEVARAGIRTPQQGQTCMCGVADFILHKRTGRDLGFDGVLIDVAKSAKEVLHSAAERARFRAALVNHEYSKVHGKTPSEVLQIFFDEGVFPRQIKHFLRQQGADVASVPIARNSRTNLRHVKAALDNDYDVLLILDLQPTTGKPRTYHAVAVTALERDARGQITRVRFYDPEFGGELRLPLAEFERLIGRPDHYGNMMVIKWDNRPWAGTTRRQVAERPVAQADPAPGGTRRQPRETDPVGTRPSDRPTWVEARQMLLHDIIVEHHSRTGTRLSPIHNTDAEGLLAIRNSGFWQQPERGGASFSREGRGLVVEKGTQAIRVKPESERFIEWREHVSGLVPMYWESGVKGVGTPKSYIPTKHLQRFRVGRTADEDGWQDFPD